MKVKTQVGREGSRKENGRIDLIDQSYDVVMMTIGDTRKTIYYVIWYRHHLTDRAPHRQQGLCYMYSPLGGGRWVGTEVDDPEPYCTEW